MTARNYSTIEHTQPLLSPTWDSVVVPVKQNKVKSVLAGILTASTTGYTYLTESDQKPFATIAGISPPHSDEPIVKDKIFEYKKPMEVLAYIRDKPNVRKFLKALPSLVQQVFDKATLRVSVFKDYEEGWSDLWIEILSNNEVEEFLVLEDRLFGLIEKDSQFVAALKHVTISCR